MNVNGIQTSQVPHHAIRTVGKDNAAATARPESSAGKANIGATANKSETSQIQAAGIGHSISNVQKPLDPLLVNYPPFFPIGKYQRLDLIKKIKGIQEEVEKSNIDPNLKKLYSTEKVSEKATDEEISTALSNLYQLRDAITGRNKVSPDIAKPGMILNVKV